MEYYGNYGDFANFGNSVNIWGGIWAFISAWLFFILLIAVVEFIAKWKIYEKMGRKGWEGVIPIYSDVVALDVLKLPIWLIVLLFIPGAVIGFNIVVSLKLAERFKKDVSFAIGLIFLPIIFYPILAFDKSTFE